MSVNDPLGDPVNTKLALVIGNSYAGVDLISGEADAAATAGALRELKFDVTLLSNGTADQIKTTLKDFRSKIANAEVVVFFYSGHGYQIAGMNYLLPVGSAVDPANPEVSMDKVLR